MKFCIAVSLLLCLMANESYQTGSNVPYTKAQKQDILDRHNLHRCETAKGFDGRMKQASNIVVMDWDDRACPPALNHAKACVFAHDDYPKRSYGKFGYVGQNLAYTGSNTNSLQTIDFYFREFNFYDWDSNTCSQHYCSHFLTEVFHNTRFICAAKASCEGGYKASHVINYAPGRAAGHYMTPGAPCSNCPAGYTKCMNGCLCALPSQCVGQSCTDNANATPADESTIRDNVNAENIIARVHGTIHLDSVLSNANSFPVIFSSHSNCTNKGTATDCGTDPALCMSEAIQWACANLCSTCHLYEGEKKDLYPEACEANKAVFCPAYSYMCWKTCNS